MMSWAEQALQLAKGAERARQEGDHVAMIALLKSAAECAAIARTFEAINDECSG